MGLWGNGTTKYTEYTKGFWIVRVVSWSSTSGIGYWSMRGFDRINGIYRIGRCWGLGWKSGGYGELVSRPMIH